MKYRRSLARPRRFASPHPAPLFRLLALPLAAMLALAASARDFLDPDELDAGGLAKFWQLQLPLDPQQVIQNVYIVDDQLYLGTNDGYCFAVHADTGVLRWVRPVVGSGYPVKRPAHAHERATFVSQTTVLELDRVTGDVVAKRDLRFPAGTAAASDGDRVFIGGLDRRVHCFATWDLLPLWRFVTNGTVQSTPVVYQGVLFVGSDDGSVYACTSDLKRYRWQTATFGPVSADLVVDENGVFVAGRDRSLYLLDLNFGELRWKARFSSALYEPPVVTPDAAYQWCADDGVVAVNISVIGVTERERWRLRRGRKLLTVDDNNAYVLTVDGKIAVCDKAKGTVKREIAANGLTQPMPSPQKMSVYLASSDGRVFCARPKGTPLPTREQLLAALLPPSESPTTAEAPPAAALAAAPEEGTVPLATQRRGAAIGGTSKVSREFVSGDSGKSDSPKPAEEPKPEEKPGEKGADGKNGNSGAKSGG